MPYSNDPNWRKFMDAKWRELAQSQKERDNFDVIQRTKFPTSTASIPGRGQAVRAQPKAAPKVPAQKFDYKAAREKSLQARIKQIETRAEPKKAGTAIYPTRKVVHEFDMPAAGKRRRELGKKVNPTEKELLEYRDLSNKMEEEIDRRQRQLNEDMSKA